MPHILNLVIWVCTAFVFFPQTPSCFPLLCSPMLCSFSALSSAQSLLSLPHFVASAAVMSVPCGEIDITPVCTLHQPAATLLRPTVFWDYYSVAVQERFHIAWIRHVFTSMSWGSEGQGGRRTGGFESFSPSLPRPVNIRRSTEVGTWGEL